jgi:hypothetical protein
MMMKEKEAQELEGTYTYIDYKRGNKYEEKGKRLNEYVKEKHAEREEKKEEHKDNKKTIKNKKNKEKGRGKIITQ